jgi:putative nucleotidyltransferase with HDIG domain
MSDNSVYTNELNYKGLGIDYTRFYNYTNAKKAQELVWLEPYTDPISGRECIGMSIPLLDQQGKVSGVLVGNISLKTFGNLLLNAKYMPKAEMFFINSSGYVKFHSGGKYSETVNVKDAGFILNPVAEAVLNLNEGYREYSFLGGNWTCSFSVINSSGWKIVSLIDTSELQTRFSTMNQDTNSIILMLGLLCIFIGMIASLFLSKSITAPLTELREGVKSITAGNLDSRIAVKSNDEIREVADAFNEMAGNLKNTYTDLLKRTDELYLNNEELQNINLELEASYQQLEATTSQLNESDTHLRKKYNELQTLNQISNTLASTMDLNNMLITVVNHIADITEYLICAIRLISEEDPNKLELKALKGVRTEKYDRSSIDIREDIIGQAVVKKCTIVIDLQKEKTQHSYYDTLYQEDEAKCIVLTPITVKSKVIGVMGTTLKEEPKGEMIELISSLSNNIAIAIDNARAYETLKNSYLKTVQSLVSVVEAKDEYTESHSIRVAKYSAFIASEMNYPKSFIEDIWVAGVLHDIGKIGISDSILNKNGALTEDEYNTIKQHSVIAYKVASKIGLRESILKAIKHHHERFDGKGYPDMIKGDEIPIMASIISVADAFDAITSNRPYRKSRSIRQGINEIVTNRGTQFNPTVVQTMEKMFLLKKEIFDKIYNDEEIDFF